MINAKNKNNRKIIIYIVLAILLNSLFFWDNTYPDRYAIRNERIIIAVSQYSLKSAQAKDVFNIANDINSRIIFLAEDNAKLLKKILIMGAIDLLIISIGFYMIKKRKH